jgi:hypothetical protein
MPLIYRVSIDNTSETQNMLIYFWNKVHHLSSWLNIFRYFTDFRKFLSIGNIIHWTVDVLRNFIVWWTKTLIASHLNVSSMHSSRSNICYNSKSYTRHFIRLYFSFLLVYLIPFFSLTTKIQISLTCFHKSAAFLASKLGYFLRILNAALMCYFYINNWSKTALDYASGFLTQSWQ